MYIISISSSSHSLVLCFNTDFSCLSFYRKDAFYPLTSQDIVCHETGHAITWWKGGNMEYHKESGGMNEAYSDILGKAFMML